MGEFLIFKSERELAFNTGYLAILGCRCGSRSRPTRLGIVFFTYICQKRIAVSWEGKRLISVLFSWYETPSSGVLDVVLCFHVSA